MSKKIGRPLSDNPRKHVVSCKLTSEELSNLDNYCVQNNISKSEVLKKSIEPIINPNQKSE